MIFLTLLKCLKIIWRKRSFSLVFTFLSSSVCSLVLSFFYFSLVLSQLQSLNFDSVFFFSLASLPHQRIKTSQSNHVDFHVRVAEYRVVLSEQQQPKRDTLMQNENEFWLNNVCIHIYMAVLYRIDMTACSIAHGVLNWKQQLLRVIATNAIFLSFYAQLSRKKK